MSNYSQSQPERKGPELFYFQPDELVFLVTHPGQDALTNKQIADLIGWANAQARDILKIDGVTIKPPREDQVISYVAKDVKYVPPTNEPPKDKEGRSKRPDIKPPDSFTMLFPSVENVSLDQLVRLGHGLHELILDDSTKKLIEPALLEEVSLNWLKSASNGGMGSGGPGCNPRFTPAIGANPAYHFQFDDAAVKAAGILGNGTGVEVAILDTAPVAWDLATAYHKWGATGINHLIAELLDPLTPIMDYQYLSPSELARLASYILRDFPYPISDHGLFVAGIIHSIVPRAKLHLIQVLNPFGVGDVRTIAAGLRDVANSIQGSTARWVVNCSVTLNDPANRQQLDEMVYDLTHQPAGITAAQQQEVNKLNALWTAAGNSGLINWLITGQAKGIEKFCNAIYVHNSRVVAAAGGDNGKLGTTATTAARPGPRYPAASQSVLGVGALTDMTVAPPTPTSYSNIAETPPSTPAGSASDGMTTFGGEADPGKGVLGIYIGSIPTPPPAGVPVPSADGWAWWCGTSFSTPIISGAVAGLLSGSNHPLTTQFAIELFYTLGLQQLATREDVLSAHQ